MSSLSTVPATTFSRLNSKTASPTVRFGMNQPPAADTFDRTKRKQDLSKAIHNAISNNSLEALTTALHALPTDPTERTEILTKTDRRGWTPLYIAAVKGDLAMATRLLEHGAPVNEGDMYSKNTPLHYVAYHHKLAMVTLLLEHGASANQKNTLEETPLHNAAHTGDLAIATLLLEHGASVNQKSDSGNTPLHDAPINGNPAMEAFLLKNGAFVNQKNSSGQTPLQRAEELANLNPRSREKYLMAAMLLLAYGADPTPLTPEFLNDTHRYAKQQIKQHTEQLLSSNNQNEEREALQWFQHFPPGGGALEWELSTESFKAFLDNKRDELLQTDFLPEDKQNSILKRVHAVFESGVPGLTNNLENLALKKIAATFQEEETSTDPK